MLPSDEMRASRMGGTVPPEVAPPDAARARTNKRRACVSKQGWRFDRFFVAEISKWIGNWGKHHQSMCPRIRGCTHMLKFMRKDAAHPHDKGEGVMVEVASDTSARQQHHAASSTQVTVHAQGG